MKNFLFLILFSFILPVNISGQSYQEMLNHDIEWQLTSCNNGCITDVYLLMEIHCIMGLIIRY